MEVWNFIVGKFPWTSPQVPGQTPEVYVDITMKAAKEPLGSRRSATGKSWTIAPFTGGSTMGPWGVLTVRAC